MPVDRAMPLPRAAGCVNAPEAVEGVALPLAAGTARATAAQTAWADPLPTIGRA